jgi:hypothetical protein
MSYDERCTEEQIAELEEELATLQRSYAAESAALRAEISAAQTAQVAANSGLTKEEVAVVREAVRTIVETVSAPRMRFAYVDLVDAAPDETYGGYKGDHTHHFSVAIECRYVEDYGDPGLYYKIVMKTQHAGVREIVQSMIGPDAYDEAPTTSWSADWDYYTKIFLKEGPQKV